MTGENASQTGATPPDDVFIVVGCGFCGRLEAARNPFPHPTEAAANAEAERLAAAHPGQRFAVFACTGVALVEPKPKTLRRTRWRNDSEIPF